MLTEQTRQTCREALAEYAHEAWSGWMKYLFSKGERVGQFKVGSEGEIEIKWVMPPWAVERWQRQMNTPYADLPESEKESDRAEADKMLAILAALDEPPTGWQPVWGIEINGIEVDAGGNSIGMAAIDAHGCEWYAEAMLPDNIRLCRLSPQPPAMPADVREAIDDALTCWMVDASISVANGVYPQAYEDKRRGTVERVRAWLGAHSPQEVAE